MPARHVVLLVALCCLFYTTRVGTAQSVDFYYSLAEWEAAVSDLQVDNFPFTPGNLVKAIELNTEPSDGEVLSVPVLTFIPEETELPYHFELHAIHDNFAYNEYWVTYPATDHLGVGATSMKNDDWELIFGTLGEPILAVAFLVVDNDESINEGITVYDAAGQVLGTTPLPHQPGELFWSVVSSEPIGRIVIEEDDVVDNADFAFLRFARPQPCPCDITGDGVVDVQDLLLLLSHWGPCP